MFACDFNYIRVLSSNLLSNFAWMRIKFRGSDVILLLNINACSIAYFLEFVPGVS